MKKSELKQNRNTRYRRNLGILDLEKIKELNKMHRFELYEYIEQHRVKKNITQIAEELSISRQSIYRILKEFENETRN